MPFSPKEYHMECDSRDNYTLAHGTFPYYSQLTYNPIHGTHIIHDHGIK